MTGCASCRFSVETKEGFYMCYNTEIVITSALLGTFYCSKYEVKKNERRE